MAGYSDDMRGHIGSQRRSFSQLRPPRWSAPSPAHWLGEAMAEDRRIASSKVDIDVASPRIAARGCCSER